MIAIIKPLIPWVMYIAVLAIALFGVLKRGRWSLYLMLLLIPLPALWYPLHALPFGKDTMDILIASCLIGAMSNAGGIESPRGSIVVWGFLGVSFCSLLNMMHYFGLGIEAAWPIVQIWKNYFEMVFLYFLAYSLLREQKHQEVALTIMAVVILLIAVREYRNFSGGASFAYDKRVIGPFLIVGLGPNHFAAFIAHFGVLLLGLLLADDVRWRRRLYFVTVLFCLHPLFFAYSRGAYAAVLFVLAIYGVLQYRLLLVLLAVLAFTWTVVLPEAVVDRVSMTSNAEGQLEDSAASRVVLWQLAESYFVNNPFFGIGFNGFEYSLRGNVLRNTHNFWAQTAAEQGVIGLAALALLFLRGYWIAWGLYRRGATAFHRGLGLGFVGCVTASIITNVFGDRFTQFVVGGYFFITFGIVERARASTFAVRIDPRGPPQGLNNIQTIAAHSDVRLHKSNPLAMNA